MIAAAATEAAGLQGKYREMQELLSAKQPEWGEQNVPQTDKFIEYAGQLELNIDQFTVDRNRPELQTKSNAIKLMEKHSGQWYANLLH